MSEYAFNPITGTLDRVGEGGGGGGNVTLNADNGPAITGDEFFIVGGEAFTNIPIMETENDGGDTIFFNNSWITPYVVDPSTTPGDKGTFQTIQAAIDKAVIDGASISVQKVIRLRQINYIENLNIPSGIYIVGDSIVVQPGAIPQYCSIQGNHTMQGTNVFSAKNVTFINPSPTEDLFSAAATLIFLCSNCVFNNGTSTGVIATLDFNYESFTNCVFFGNPAQTILRFNGGTSILDNCIFPNSSFIEATNHLIRYYNCPTVGTLICDNANLIAKDTLFVGETNCVTGNGSACQYSNCQFNSPETSVTHTGQQYFMNCSLSPGNGNSLYPANSLINSVTSAVSGTMLVSRPTDVNSTASDGEYCYEIDTSAGPITITLVSAPTIDRSWIFKDATGNAGINNITIQVQSNTGTIDGQDTYVISENFGAVCIKAQTNGTDYLTIWGNKQPSGIPIGELAYFATGNGDDYIDDEWLPLQGQILNQADYPTLFNRLGYVNGPFTAVNTTTTFSAQNLQSVIFDGTRFVAGGGTALGTSTDGKTWAPATWVGTSLTDITFNGSLYSLQSLNANYTTTDFVTYNAYFNSASNGANYLAYGNSVEVAAASGSRFTSYTSDFLNWWTRSPQGGSIEYNGGVWVAGAPGGVIMTSTNLSIGWSIIPSNLTSTISNIKNLNGIWVALSSSTSTIGVSTNGYSWNAIATGTTATWQTSAFGLGLYLLGGSSGQYRATTDFVTWTQSQTGIGGTVNSLTFGNSLFVSNVSSTNSIAYSTNGTSWTLTTATTAGSVGCVEFMNGLFYAGATGGMLGTSTDAITWTWANRFGSNAATQLRFLNNLYIAVLSGGNIASSTDAITWSTNTTLTNQQITSITFDGTNYWNGSQASFIQTSTDLVNWTLPNNIPFNTNEQITDLNFGNSVFLISTSQGRVFSSTDGLSWTPHATATTGTLIMVNGVNGKYFVSTSTGKLWVSNNLTTWTAANSQTTSSLNAITFANGIYLMGGGNGYIRSSTDGVQWDQLTSNLTTQTTLSIASNANIFALAGNTGFVGYTESIYPYNPATEFQLPTDAQAAITLEFPSNFRRSLYIKAK